MRSKTSSLFAVAVASLLSLGVVRSSSLDIDWKIPSRGESYGTVTATVGDTITFSYSGGHNVLLHPSGTCDGGDDAVFLGSTSPTEYTFKQVGMYTFVCGVAAGTHCAVGQLINVNVTDVENGADEEDADEDTSQEENSDEEDTETDVDEEDTETVVGEEDEDQVLEKYSEFFNPEEEKGLLEFQMKPYKIPAESTTYVDFVFNIPDDIADIVHIVIGDVINSQPKHLHHFVLSGCTESIEPSQEGLPLSEPPESCTIPLGGWAVGGVLYGGFSSESGMLFGSGLGIKAVSLNVHYTDGEDIDLNYANDGTNAIGSDGVRILYTPNLRPKTIHLKTLIDVGGGPRQMNLPPNIPRYFYTKTCTVEPSCQDASDDQMKKYGLPFTCEQAKSLCSVVTGFEKLISQIYCPVTCGYCSSNEEDTNPFEYYVSAINYHAHLTGREMYTTLLPKSGDAPIDLESKDVWIFDFQETYQLHDDQQDKPYFKLYPGDKIQSSCIYDSTSRDDTTYFDISTYDEMCITQVHVLIDTPDFSTDDGESSLALLELKSFSCALDDSSDIWGGTLEADEDGRDIWKDHPMTEANCTFPVGPLFGGSFSLKADTAPTFDVRGVCSDISFEFCNEGTVFEKDSIAGESCNGGSLDGVDSNDVSSYSLEGTETFEELCTNGGGNSQPYTCSDAENFLTLIDAPPETIEFLITSWWQPKCCDGLSDSSSHSSPSICTEGTVFEKDSIAGESCNGGSLNEVDSNDVSRYSLEGTETFKELCTNGGGNSQPYTCSDAESFLNGPSASALGPESIEFLITSWWQPKCCDALSDSPSDSTIDSPSDSTSDSPSDSPSHTPTNDDELPTSSSDGLSNWVIRPLIFFTWFLQLLPMI